MVEVKKSEIGQALVLIVLGIVGLLGFAALAIDGGRVYIDRRSMQNASDTGSLAGALEYVKYLDANDIHYGSGFDCGSIQSNVSTTAEVAAIGRTYSNGYTVDNTIDESSGDYNGVRTACNQVNTGAFIDKYIDVDTYVTAQTPSSFAQFVFGGPLEQTVISTARVRPQVTLGFGQAIVALNEQSCSGNQNGAMFDGSFDVSVEGGGIFSNGCLITSGSGDVVVTGTISYAGENIVDYKDTGPGLVSPTPTNNMEPIPENATNIAEPSCGSTNYGVANSGGNLSPGNYTSITVNSSEIALLDDGLYCVDGDVDIKGGGTFLGDNITIFIRNGDFKTAGNSVVNISAYPYGSITTDNAIPTVLIYLANNNYGTVSLLGTADSSYTGVVYAPDGEIEVGGTGSLLNTYNTQLIGYNVFVHGNALIDIQFDKSQTVQTPPTLDLQK